jgi:hypothetical protein
MVLGAIASPSTLLITSPLRSPARNAGPPV